MPVTNVRVGQVWRWHDQSGEIKVLDVRPGRHRFDMRMLVANTKTGATGDWYGSSYCPYWATDGFDTLETHAYLVYDPGEP
jgi:hypothetical protein